MAATSSSTLTKFVTCDGVPVELDPGFWKKGISKEKSIYQNTHPSQLIEAHELYGNNCVVFPIIMDVKDHDSKSWGKSGSGKKAQCPMNNIYIVVKGEDGKPEYRSMCITMTRIGISSSILEPEKRFFPTGNKVMTRVGICWRPTADGYEPRKDDARRKEYLTAIKIFYDCLEHHIDTYKKAIKKAYIAHYVPKDTKDTKKGGEKITKKKAEEEAEKKKAAEKAAKKKAAEFIEKHAVLDKKFSHKVKQMEIKDPITEEKTPIEGSMSLQIDFNLSNNGSTKWPDTFKYQTELKNDGVFVNNIDDVIVDKAILDEHKDKPAAKRLELATVPGITEENIHTFGLFKSGAQITTNTYHGLLAHTNLGVSCRTKFKKDNSGRRWIIVDASKAYTGTGGDNPEEFLDGAYGDSDDESEPKKETDTVDALLGESDDEEEEE
tara:strand:+ start:427 stop:1734 length:1308 start_codon:yes stop_codon:yes gene_type:complete